METIKTNNESQKLAVSLKSLSEMLDAHRSSVRRWLTQAGIKPVSLGKGKNGAIRYKWEEVKSWLDSMEHIE
jgi:hypothetical protein